MKQVKPKKCRYCKAPFVPVRPLQTICGWECAAKMVDKINHMDRAKAEKAQRQQIKVRKLELKPLQYWLKRAQKAVNDFVREGRDKDEGCISCGTHDAEEWHAGHFVSVGASSSLRFDTNNIHKQCRQCNYFGAGALIEYERRLIGKIGAAAVEWLKIAPRAKKWTREECQAIESEYKLKLKELNK